MNGSAKHDSVGAVAQHKHVLRDFGTQLRRARESRQLSIEAAAAACMLSDRQIVALECADLEPFYSSRYAQRAVRRYAELLQVSSIPTLEPTWDDRGPSPLPRDALSSRILYRLHRERRWTLQVLSVSLVAIGAIWYSLLAYPIDSSQMFDQAECSQKHPILPSSIRSARAEASARPKEAT